MDIKELTEAMHIFVQSQGWYAPESRRPQTLRNLAISLSLEAAEVLELFQWKNEIESDKSALGEELADVALYLFQIASIAEIDLERTILGKLRENYQRTWDQS
jgi:NTP pyrophosphatase (non-canonical NTP hydrolase)